MATPTISAARPAAPPPPAPPRRAAPAPVGPPRLAPWPELTLAALTTATVIGLGRLFADASFFGRVLVLVLVSHALAATTRRLRWSTAVAALVSLVGLAVAATLVVLPFTTSTGVPSALTWHTAWRDLTDAWQRFGNVLAPAPVTRGFVLASAIAGWLAAFVADTAAFRLGLTFEAAVPALTMFVFASALGAHEHRIAYALVFLLPLGLFLLLRGAERDAQETSWFGGRSRGGPAAIARAGVVPGVAAVLVALLLGPNLPGARSPALLAWRQGPGQGPTSRATVSPLVTIRNRLVDQSNLELFTVQADAPAYWRLTSLDRFDGTIWSSLGIYRPAHAHLPAHRPKRGGQRTLHQEFAVSALASIWLPAAFQPEGLDGAGDARYDNASSSLVTDAETTNGLTYRVESAVPDLTAGELQTVPAGIPSDVSRNYLSLPSDFPARIVREAQTVTTGATTPYQKALALEHFFRTQFTYDLNVPHGHGDSEMERFLFVTRRGYCEQFAGTYAAMARALGLPARVAVGFVPGDTDDTGLFHVEGKDAHAWPEIYLSGFGWVPFEPTPTRGIPGGEAYTGVPAPATPRLGTSTPATTPPTTAAPNTSPSTPKPPRKETDVSTSPTVKHHHRSLLERAALALAVLAAVLALVAVTLALVIQTWRRRRRRATTGASEQVLLAWQEATQSLAVVGAPRQRWETPREYATRVGGVDRAGVAADALRALAADASVAAYAADAVEPPVAERARAASDEVMTTALRNATWRQKLMWWLNPSPLLRQHT